MNGTYRAIEVSKPGIFTEVSRPLQDPPCGNQTDSLPDTPPS
jgi:hypothetical protein